MTTRLEQDPNEEFRAAGLGHMRQRRGPGAKWKKHYGEKGYEFHVAANSLELIPTQRSVDFILKHHMLIGEMLRAGVLFKDIWRAASAKGLNVRYEVFYVTARRFADFLGVPRKKDRKRLRDDRLRELAARFDRAGGAGLRVGNREIVVESTDIVATARSRTESAAPKPESESGSAASAARARRRALLRGGGESLGGMVAKGVASAIGAEGEK